MKLLIQRYARIGLLQSLLVAMVLATGTLMPNFSHAAPPAPDADPIEDPLVYDLQTALQIEYWSSIVDSLLRKFADNIDDSEEISDAGEVWEIIEANQFNITRPEAQVLCLYMDDEGEAPPADLFDFTFPSWPNCGGILQTIFGADFISRLQNSSGEEREFMVSNSQYILGSMGIHAHDIQEVIHMQGADDVDIPDDDTARAGLDCKTPADNIKPYVISGCGVFCTVTKVIMGLLHSASEAMVTAITGNAAFQTAVMAALVLYTVIYGAMVVLGLVQVALGDALLRIAKLGVVAMLLTSETAMLFFDMVRCFFIEGTTYLIQQVLAIGTSAVHSLGAAGHATVEIGELDYSGGEGICSTSFDPENMGPGPLSALEALLTQIFSPHMILVLIALIAASFPFGIILLIFLLWGLFMLLQALLHAVVIYLTALIAQYLLLSLLPIFIAFLLFDRTKYLFEGWVNQLVSYSLAPIFLFAYISLFILVVEAALAQILDVRICWAKMYTIAWVFDISFWQFFNWVEETPLTMLPFNFFQVLIFVLLTYLMKEFFTSIEDIARDIGNSYVYVSKAASQLQGWFRGKKNTLKGKAVEQKSRFVRGGINKASGAVLGAGTNSQTGQRGVRGVGGASRGGSTPRSGPK